jgi:hypothetical protein
MLCSAANRTGRRSLTGTPFRQRTRAGNSSARSPGPIFWCCRSISPTLPRAASKPTETGSTTGSFAINRRDFSAADPADISSASAMLAGNKDVARRADERIMPRCAEYLCALHKFSLTLAQIDPEMGTWGAGRVRVICVFQEPYPIESAEFSASVPLLRTSHDNHRDHTGTIQRRCGIRQPGGHHPWLRTVRYDADAHGAAARRKRPGHSNARLTAGPLVRGKPTSANSSSVLGQKFPAPGRVRIWSAVARPLKTEGSR